MTSSTSHGLLFDVLGEQFVEFVTNESSEAVASRRAGDASLKPEGEAILDSLVQMLDSMQPMPDFGYRVSLSRLGQHQPELDASWLVAARLSCGGDVDLPDPDDRALRLLLDMLRDVYALFLIPRGEAPDGIRGAETLPALLEHPARAAFQAAIMHDDALSRLFPEGASSEDHPGVMVYRSTGVGGAPQLTTIADGLLRAGWDFAGLRSDVPSLAEHAAGVLEVFGLTRRAISGETVRVPAMIGLAGCSPANGEAALIRPWGTLRRATPHDARYVPPGLAGKVTTTTADGRHVDVDYAGDLVMEMDAPFKAVLLAPTEKPERAIATVTTDAVTRQMETLRLALLLSWDASTPPPTLVDTWRRVLDPMPFGSGMAWSDPRRLPFFRPVELSAEQVRHWHDWIDLVDRHDLSQIEIAVRRTLRAAAERADPVDSFIDSVIAWENLFGSSEGEQTLRISGAIAWLLGKNGDERAVHRKKAAALYRERSKIVHGAATPILSQAVAHQQEALSIAVRALRELISRRPDLLLVTSSERSINLLLGRGH